MTALNSFNERDLCRRLWGVFLLCMVAIFVLGATDREIARASPGLTIGGTALLLAAMVMLTIGLRHPGVTGVTWWKWYDGPAQRRGTG